MATRKTDTTDFFATMFKTPQVDMEKVLDAQRKNVEALIEAQRVAFEGYKGAVERQVAIVKDSVTEFSGVTGEAFSGKTPEANASKQIELAQTAMRTAFENVREVAELTTKANQDAFAVLQKRFNDGVEEFKAVAA